MGIERPPRPPRRHDAALHSGASPDSPPPTIWTDRTGPCGRAVGREPRAPDPGAAPVRV